MKGIIQFIISLGGMFWAAPATKCVYIWVIMALCPALPALPFVAFIAINFVIMYFTCNPFNITSASVIIQEKFNLSDDDIPWFAMAMAFAWNLAMIIWAAIIGLFL